MNENNFNFSDIHSNYFNRIIIYFTINIMIWIQTTFKCVLKQLSHKRFSQQFIISDNL